MRRYVVGFAFSPPLSTVVLVEKNRPEWQAGRLNGVGGKIEEADADPAAAMAREFWEETGAEIPRADWVPVAVMRDPESEVHVFAAVSEEAYWVRTVTDERIVEALVSEFVPDRPTGRPLPNLRWLIPMAVSRLLGEESRVLEVRF